MRKKNRYEQKMTGRRSFLQSTLTMFAVMALAWCCSFVSLADVTGTVKVESANIRGSADSSSAAVGSVTKGKTVSIKSETTDASGALWYEVYVNANTTGYVRADLIDRDGSETLPTSSGTQSAGQTDEAQGDSQADSGASSLAETGMDAQYAKVSVQAAKVRPEPSTNVKEVESLPNGTEVIVSGQSNGTSDGKVWYFVTFTSADGSSKTGFVRSDLIELGDMVPVAEEEPVPEEQPAPEETQEPVSQDYEVVLKDGEWCLIDNIGGGYEYKLQPLLDAYSLQGKSADENAKNLVKQRIAIVALGVVAAVLLIVVIIMAIKLRDAYYEDYEDDEDDEEDEEENETEEADEVSVRRRRRTESDNSAREEERPVRRNVREPEISSRRAVRESEVRAEQAEEMRVKPAAKRKAKNFLLDDDDFEFEFLNMDDKDL